MENKNTHNETFLAKWYAGEMSDETLKKLVSQEDFYAYTKLKKGLSILDDLEKPVDYSFARLHHKINKKKQKVIPLYSNWIIKIAASVILLFGIFNFFNTPKTEINTTYGEHKTIVLKDGSQVILNAKSKLIYNEDNWDSERALHLDGEAFFKVAKGKTFTVHTSNGSVEVLGTQFNVKSNLDFFEVVCYEGKVNVVIEKDNQVLVPKQRITRIEKNQVQNTIANGLEPTWITGESTFKSVPLYSVIDALEKEYNVAFDTSSVDTSVIFSGVFPHKNLDMALKTVFKTLHIKCINMDKGNIKLSYIK